MMMAVTKGIFLVVVVLLMYAGVAGAQAMLPPYRCTGSAPYAQPMQLNIGRPGGYIQLVVPVTVIQQGNLAVIRECLLRHHVFNEKQVDAYIQAVEQCRAKKQRNKVTLKKGPVASISTVSTGDAAEYDACYRQGVDTVLENSETE